MPKLADKRYGMNHSRIFRPVSMLVFIVARPAVFVQWEPVFLPEYPQLLPSESVPSEQTEKGKKTVRLPLNRNRTAFLFLQKRTVRAKLISIDFRADGHGAVPVEIVPCSIELLPAAGLHKACRIKVVPCISQLSPAAYRISSLVIEPVPGSIPAQSPAASSDAALPPTPNSDTWVTVKRSAPSVRS